jgi:8-hydroxy-5-deazaflavin:NADPH oxidoreductase
MKIGIIGAGMIGSTVGKLWVDAGHEVRFASRHPEDLQPLAKKLGARASAGTPAEAANFGEIVMLTIPLKAVPELARDVAPLLIDKVVLDTGNAYEKRDGSLAVDATRDPRGSAGWAAAMFPGARWVKAFNSVYFKTLETEAHRQGERVGVRWRATIVARSTSRRNSYATPDSIPCPSNHSHAARNSSQARNRTTTA